MPTDTKDFFYAISQHLNPLSANTTKWSNTLYPMNCFSVFDPFVGLVLKGLLYLIQKWILILLINQFQPNVAFYIETSHLVCSALHWAENGLNG